MPTPARTTLADIVAAGRDIAETSGLDGLTMQAVARRVGVRAPSLYKHVAHRAELVRLVVDDTVRDLGSHIDEALAAAPADPRRRLAAVADALREFAHRRPGAYRLVFAPLPAGEAAGAGVLEAASTAVRAVARDLAGPDRELEAARTVTAWATGFLGMELAGAFHLGGDVDRAWDYGVARLGEALARR